MYLYIKGFRTIQEYECEFQTESITLISGPSGIGKTTIMNAIYWCLYGTLKNVRKFGTKSGTCLVKIRLGDIKITRSKSPESLSYEQEETPLVLKDKEAQEKIIELFGNSDIWLSCCYLRQGSRNRFLESSPSDRLSLLSELCFSSHSPETYVEKIEDKTKELSREFEKQNDFYKRDLEHFQKRRKEYPEYKKDLLTEDEKRHYNQLIDSKKLSDLEAKLSTSERLESSYLSLSETKAQLEEKFPNYKAYLLTNDQKNYLMNILKEDKSSDSPHRFLTQLEKEIQRLEGQKVLLESYQEQFSRKTLQMDNYTQFLLCDEDVVQMMNRLETLPLEIESYEKEWRESECQRTNLHNWTQQLDQLISESRSYMDIHTIEEKIDDISATILKTKELMERKRKSEELLSELENYREVMDDSGVEIREVSMDEISRSLHFEKKISERKQFLEKLSIQDEKNVVQKAIDVRRRVCDVQHLWTYVFDLQELESRINECEDKIERLGKRKDWILEDDLPRKILELNSAKDLFACPKCSTSLRFVSNTLVECHTSITKDKIDIMTKCIEDSKKRIEYLIEKKRLEDDMNHKMKIFEEKCEKMNLTHETLYEYPKLEECEKEKLVQEIIELERYLPSYDETFEEYEKLRRCQRKWEGIKVQRKIDDVLRGVDMSSCGNILELEKEKEKLVLAKSRIQYLGQMMDGLKQKINKCSWNESLSLDGLESLKEKLKKCDKDVILHQKAKEISELFQKIEELQRLNIDECLELKRKELEKKREKIEKERREWEEAKKKIQLCENAETIQNIEDKMREISFECPREIKDSILKMKSDIDESREKLRKSEKAEELLNEKKILEKQRMDVIELCNRVSVISEIKSIANELEHKRMISILNTINDFANEILTILFDEPIKIEFMVYKTCKTKDKVKPSIVYKLLYRGYEMDHVDQLSGGEGDRVSLAVTCALFQFNKFPFLLLDEFASSLDLNTKEMAIKSLKTFLGIGDVNDQMDRRHKGILCISHDTVEGLYDYTMKL